MLKKDLQYRNIGRTLISAVIMTLVFFSLSTMLDSYWSDAHKTFFLSARPTISTLLSTHFSFSICLQSLVNVRSLYRVFSLFFATSFRSDLGLKNQCSILTVEHTKKFFKMWFFAIISNNLFTFKVKFSRAVATRWLNRG